MRQWMHGRDFPSGNGLGNLHFLACTSQIWWRRRDSNLRPRAGMIMALPVGVQATTPFSSAVVATGHDDLMSPCWHDRRRSPPSDFPRPEAEKGEKRTAANESDRRRLSGRWMLSGCLSAAPCRGSGTRRFFASGRRLWESRLYQAVHDHSDGPLVSVLETGEGRAHRGCLKWTSRE